MPAAASAGRTEIGGQKTESQTRYSDSQLGAC